MKVVDVIGNIARVRTVFFLDPLNNIEISEDDEVTVQQGVASDMGTWIADTGQLDFDWTDVFANPHHVRNNYMKPVAELHDTLDDTRADDGNRTLAAVANSNDALRGILEYGVKSDSDATESSAVDSAEAEPAAS